MVMGLTGHEIKALQAFVHQVEKKHQHQIRQISLFGSKARGDSQPDSDIDLLVITNQEDRILRRAIIDISSTISLEYDVLLSPRIISAERWEKKQAFSLYRNIARDARAIPTE